MDYIRFFKQNRRFLLFGLLMTFFSSFGQTFFISLYVPSIIEHFELSNSLFGSLYAAATLTSGFLLAYFGKFIDTCDLRKYTIITAVLLLVGWLTVASATVLPILFLGLLAIRFAGQGLLSHISLTSISRFYHQKRGKALSITVLGYPLGESILPLLIGFLIGIVGWRSSIAFNVSMAIVLVPLMLVLVGKKSDFCKPAVVSEEAGCTFSRAKLLRQKSFYVVAANTLVLPCLATGLLFYQMSLAGEKGWSVEWMASCFIAFALSRTLCSVLSGKLIDWFSAMRLFPFYLIPFALALVLLLSFDHRYIALVYMVLMGVSFGLSSTVKAAVLAEMYGTARLGAVRSLFTSLMVFSTAGGPIIFGLLMDAHGGINMALSAALVMVLSVIAASIVYCLPVFAQSHTEPAFSV